MLTQVISYRTRPSHSLGPSSPTSFKDVAAAAEPYDFPGTIFPRGQARMRPLQQLVSSFGRSCKAGSSLGGLHQLVASGGEIAIGNSPTGAPSPSPFHHCVNDCLGHAFIRPHCSRIWSEEEKGLHISVLDMKAVHLPSGLLFSQGSR